MTDYFRRKLLLTRESYRRISIHLSDYRNKPPVLIYQMGKVGSTTVYESLRKAGLGMPVYHVHLLSSIGIRSAEKFSSDYSDSLSLSILETGRLLSRKLKADVAVPVKIITMVREPVSRAISNYFENQVRLGVKLSDDEEENKSRIYAGLDCVFRAYMNETSPEKIWFDQEILGVFGLDVFDLSFDKRQGYDSFEIGNKHLFISTLERLDDIFDSSLPQFLGYKGPIEVRKKNIADQKKTSTLYKDITSHYKLDRALCEKIYSTEFVKHFYTDDMIASFLERWSK